MSKICEYCGKGFEPGRIDQFYCCANCRKSAWRKKHQKKTYHFANEKTYSKILYFRNPIGGHMTPVSEIGKCYPLELKYRIIQGGRGLCRFIPAQGGYAEVKRQLLLEFERQVSEYKKMQLDGCDLFSAKCIDCTQPLENCPDEQRGLSLKIKKDKRAEQVKQMKNTGLTNEEIAAKIGVNVRTIRRDLIKTKKKL